MRRVGMLALFLLLVSFVTGPVEAGRRRGSGSPYAGGDGSAASPYRIATSQQLQAIGARGTELDLHFELAADLDLLQYAPGDLTPIGTGHASGFTGSFDGAGHGLSNLRIVRPGQDRVGLFARVGSPGQVFDLALVDVTVEGRDATGALVGELDGGRVEACSVSGTVRGDDSVGGLVGRMRGSATLRRSASTTNVTGDAGVGGVVGRSGSTQPGARLELVYAHGPVEAPVEAGALVGELATLSLGQGYSIGPVSADDGSSGCPFGSMGAASMADETFFNHDLQPVVGPTSFDGFVEAGQIPGSRGTQQSFLGDFDDDGDLDLVETYGSPSAIATFLNDGAGSFTLASEVLTSDVGFVAALGDVTGDGIPDVAWAKSVGSGTEPFLIYYGSSDGSLAPGQDLGKTSDVSVLEFGHIDSDGFLDLVVGRERGPIDVYAGTASGTLVHVARPGPNRQNAAAISIGDFDLDEDADILIGSWTDSLHLYEQTAPGVFANGVRLDTPDLYIRKLFSADLDGNGTLDVLVATAHNLLCPDSVYLGNGDGTFSPLQPPTLCNDVWADGSTDLDLADLDGDDELDVVALRGGDVFQLGRGNGTFEAGELAFDPPILWSSRLVLGDLDGQEPIDALVRDGACCDSPTRVYLGQSHTPTLTCPGEPTSVLGRTQSELGDPGTYAPHWPDFDANWILGPSGYPELR